MNYQLKLSLLQTSIWACTFSRIITNFAFLTVVLNVTEFCHTSCSSALLKLNFVVSVTKYCRSSVLYELIRFQVQVRMSLKGHLVMLKVNSVRRPFKTMYCKVFYCEGLLNFSLASMLEDYTLFPVQDCIFSMTAFLEAVSYICSLRMCQKLGTDIFSELSHL
jgi:hypothetical protein